MLDTDTCVLACIPSNRSALCIVIFSDAGTALR